MSNEAVLYRETAPPTSYTVSDSTGIEYGTILKAADPNTASAASGRNDVIAGIAAYEKIANNGQTKLAVWREGEFKVTASGSITNGDALVVSGPTANNLVQTATVNDENILGYAKETATNGETFLMELRPTTMNLA